MIALTMLMALSEGVEAGQTRPASIRGVAVRMDFTGGQRLDLPSSTESRNSEISQPPPEPPTTENHATTLYRASKPQRLQPKADKPRTARRLRGKARSRRIKPPALDVPKPIATGIPFVAKDFPPWAIGAFAATTY